MFMCSCSSELFLSYTFLYHFWCISMCLYQLIINKCFIWVNEWITGSIVGYLMAFCWENLIVHFTDLIRSVNHIVKVLKRLKKKKKRKRDLGKQSKLKWHHWLLLQKPHICRNISLPEFYQNVINILTDFNKNSHQLLAINSNTESKSARHNP